MIEAFRSSSTFPPLSLVKIIRLFSLSFSSEVRDFLQICIVDHYVFFLVSLVLMFGCLVTLCCFVILAIGL